MAVLVLGPSERWMDPHCASVYPADLRVPEVKVMDWSSGLVDQLGNQLGNLLDNLLDHLSDSLQVCSLALFVSAPVSGYGNKLCPCFMPCPREMWLQTPSASMQLSALATHCSGPGLYICFI